MTETPVSDIAQAEPEKAPEPERSVFGRMGRGLLWALCILVVFGVAGAGLALTLPGRSFEAPAWVETRVEQRIQEVLPQYQVRVQRMRVAFEDNMRPRIGLQDVELTDGSGLTRLSLSDIDLGLSLTAASQGQIQPRDLHVAGVVVAVSRARDGTLDFSFGQTGTARAQYSDLPSALAAVTETLDDPRLDRMERVLLDGLTIRYDDARAGRNWTVDGGQVSVLREDEAVRLDGTFAVLGGRNYVASLETAITTRLDTGAVGFSVDVQDFAAQDLATQSPALAWLNVLRASISGTLEGEIGRDGALSPLKASLDLGAGVVQPTEATTPIPFDAARTTFTYDPADGVIGFSDLDLGSKWLSMGGTGQVLLGEVKNGLPTDYTGQFQLTRVSGNPGDLFAETQTLEGADLDLKITLNPFELVLGQALIRDEDVPIRATGRVAAGPEGWLYGVEAFAETLTREKVMGFWPASFQTRSRDWVAQNVQKADLRNVQFATRNDRAGGDPELYLGFGFTGATTKILKTLPPITSAVGQFTLFENRLVVMADSGRVAAPKGGTITFGASEFVIPNVRSKGGLAEVALSGDGSVTAVLSLLDEEPFKYLSNAGQPVSLAKTGKVAFSGTVLTPLGRKPEPGEVKFAFDGKARDVTSDVLVPGRVLAAANLTVRAENSGLKVAGKGTLSGVPFDGSWSQPLGKKDARGQISAKVTLSDKGLRAFGIKLPSGTMRGSGQGDLAITLGRNRAASFELSSSLAGIGLAVPTLGWRMSEGQTGRFNVAGSLGKPVKVDRISLTAPGMKASGAIDLTAAGAFSAARLDKVAVGGWLDAAVTLKSRGANATPAITVQSGRIDMRNAPFGASGGGAGAGGGDAPLNLSLSRLTISEGITLAPFQGTFTMGQGLTGSFRGSVNGAATVEGQVSPSRDSTGFVVTSDDAGRVLAAAGLLKKANGGSFKLRMRPVKGKPGHYDGDLDIKSTRLRDAPAIAALLSAISVVGILEQLGGEGIFFSDVEALFRLTPEQVIITKSSAVGPSMGISMDGFYRLRDGKMDVRGVVSPIYLINGIGALFSRNKEGLFGFNYWIKGTPSDPRVGVNPMSIFTPGMFRDLFRRPPPKVK